MASRVVAGMVLPKKPIVFFDGVCVLCNAGVRFIIKRDAPNSSDNKIAFCRVQSDVGRTILSSHNVTEKQCMERFCVMTTDGRILNASSAALHLARYLPFPYPLLSVGLVIPKFARDFIYDIFAKNRYNWFGTYDECLVYKGNEHVLQRFIDKDQIDSSQNLAKE